MAAIICTGFVAMFMVNLTGRPSVKYGIPFPVLIRASLSVSGANLPAVLRAIISIFWYGVQTYFASIAVALLMAVVWYQSGSELLPAISSIFTGTNNYNGNQLQAFTAIMSGYDGCLFCRRSN